MGNRRKWWMIPLALVVILGILAAVFRHTLIVYLAPKAVLTSVLTNTVSTLETRFTSGPAAVLVQGIDPNGKNTVDLQLDTQNGVLGDIRYEMNIQMEHAPRRILAQGQAIHQGKALDLSVYLDGDFAALSSASLLQGNYYGLTYETFPQDVRSSALLQLFLSEDMIRQWEEKVRQLQSTMNTSVDIPDLSQIDSKRLIPGIMALNADVEREVLMIDGEKANCFAISFDTTGEQILAGLNYLRTDLPVSIEPNSEISVTFYLWKDALVKMKAEIESDASESDLSVILGTDPARDDIQILLRNARGFREMSIQSAYDETVYHETIAITQSQNNTPSETVISYNWNRNNGDMLLSVTKEQEKTSISMNLQKGQSGFLLETGDFEGLMHILTGSEDSGNSACTMAVTKGAQVTVPEYKNFDQWSMEDMVTLLSGIGGLLGLKIA